MTQSWWHLTITCNLEDTDAVAVAIVAATGQGAEEPEPGVLTTVLEEHSAATALVDGLASEFENLHSQIVEAEPVNWLVHWRDGVETRRFGRLVVTPTWLPVEEDEGSVVVTLDPESAFGSGEHGSTRAAMILLERHLKPSFRVLDFGSGSGILAIAAVRIGAANAVGIEVDEDALPIAERNAQRNNVSNRVTFLSGDAAELGALAGPADLVCSNILRTVNMLLLPAIQESLKPDGVAIFSGMELPEEKLFRPFLENAGWHIIDDCRDTDWWAVAARRP